MNESARTASSEILLNMSFASSLDIAGDGVEELEESDSVESVREDEADEREEAVAVLNGEA